MKKHLNTLLAVTLCALSTEVTADAQVTPTILQIDIANEVQYFEDTTDFSRLATVPGITAAMPAANFRKWIQIGDIVAVNGQPVKGTLTVNARTITQGPTLNAGAAISDTSRNNIQ